MSKVTLVLTIEITSLVTPSELENNNRVQKIENSQFFF
jgi:hypothetical protein